MVDRIAEEIAGDEPMDWEDIDPELLKVLKVCRTECATTSVAAREQMELLKSLTDRGNRIRGNEK